MNLIPPSKFKLYLLLAFVGGFFTISNLMAPFSFSPAPTKIKENFYHRYERMRHQDWVRNLWDVPILLNESVSTCPLPFLGGVVPFPKEIQNWNGCTAPIFSIQTQEGDIEVTCDAEKVLVETYQATPDTSLLFQQILRRDKTRKCKSTLSTFPLVNGTVTLKPMSEMIRVVCNGKNNFHLRNVFDREIVEKNSKVVNQLFVKKPPSVAFVVLDTTSRFSFLYRMPRTVSFLEELERTSQGQSQVFQFLRHNIVGVSTYQNIPQLFGGCPSAPSGGFKSMAECVNSTWLSSHYMDLGYAVAEATLLKPPVFGRAHHRVDFRRDMCLEPAAGRSYVNHESGNMKYAFISNDMRAHCLGGKLPEVDMWDYTLQFHRNYAALPRYSYNHVISSHVDGQNGLTILDEDLKHFLSSLLLNETFVVLVGDHGLGYGSYSTTPFGQMEYKNPIFLMIAPSAYLNEEMEHTLLENSQKLTTQWDIHNTFLHLPSPFMKSPLQFPLQYQQGVSPDSLNLMTSPVPFNRTCEDAGITSMLCQCVNWEPTQLEEGLERRIRESIIQEVNTLGHAQNPELCILLNSSHFQTTRVLQSRLQTVSIGSGQSKKSGEQYRVRIEALKDPSKGKMPELLAFTGLVTVTAGKMDPPAAVKRLSIYEQEPCNSGEEREWCVCKEGNSFE